MRTNLRPVMGQTKLSDATIHILNGLVDQSPDEARDRRALAVVCRDGFEIAEAMERLAQWRKLFNSCKGAQ